MCCKPTPCYAWLLLSPGQGECVSAGAFVLVDYDNLPQSVRAAGLATLVRRIESSVLGAAVNPTELHVRLYGGWYNVTGLTNAGTLLTQEIGATFPIMISDGTRITRRVTCEIATSLIDSKGDLFLFTMRERRGMRSLLKANVPPHCIDPAVCTILAVGSWSSGACPNSGCPVSAADSFTYSEQKLTDTLLCADVFALSRRSPAPPTFVLSNDDDMTPAILLAAKAGAPISHIRSSPSPKFYDGMLRQNNVQILVL